VGRDAAGRALVETIRRDGVRAQVVRIAGAPTGRIGVVVTPDGERSFVQDRGAAALLRPEDVQATWFTGIDALHLPTYSLIGEPLARSGREAVRMARAGGATISVDLASVGPLMAHGRRGARALIEEVAPDILFATAGEAEAFLGRYAVDGLLELASIAVVKRGSKGATVLAREGAERLRLEVATEHVVAADTTGAGDAFDAGFLFGWFSARAAGKSLPVALQRAAVTGHRTATRQLRSVRPELSFG
jgi:sugar/nucleoside kinase (ribokinase family)